MIPSTSLGRGRCVPCGNSLVTKLDSYFESPSGGTCLSLLTMEMLSLAQLTEVIKRLGSILEVRSTFPSFLPT